MAILNSTEFDRLKLEYEKICESHQAISTFRGQLLGVLPIASGAGIFLLSDGNTNPVDRLGMLGVFIGLFGFLVTIGLFIHEIYGIQTCLILRERGTALEMVLNFRKGQFQDMPPALMGDLVGPKGAALLIYSTVSAAWLFVAVASISTSLLLAAIIAVSTFALLLVLGLSAFRLFSNEVSEEQRAFPSVH